VTRLDAISWLYLFEDFSLVEYALLNYPTICTVYQYTAVESLAVSSTDIIRSV
jgi:hypothetical protein